MKRWKPRNGERYYYIAFYTAGSGLGNVTYDNYYKYSDDAIELGHRYRCGNCFRTRKEARSKFNAIRKLLKERI